MTPLPDGAAVDAFIPFGPLERESQSPQGLGAVLLRKCADL